MEPASGLLLLLLLFCLCSANTWWGNALTGCSFTDIQCEAIWNSSPSPRTHIKQTATVQSCISMRWNQRRDSGSSSSCSPHRASSQPPLLFDDKPSLGTTRKQRPLTATYTGLYDQCDVWLRFPQKTSSDVLHTVHIWLSLQQHEAKNEWCRLIHSQRGSIHKTTLTLWPPLFFTSIHEGYFGFYREVVVWRPSLFRSVLSVIFRSYCALRRHKSCFIWKSIPYCLIKSNSFTRQPAAGT